MADRLEARGNESLSHRPSLRFGLPWGKLVNQHMILYKLLYKYYMKCLSLSKMFSHCDVRWMLTNLNYFETTSPSTVSAAQLRLQNTRRRLAGLRGSARPHSRQAEGAVSTAGTLGEPVRSGSKGAGRLAKALAAQGLALPIGYLHSDKKGRNSLVWDAIEPLRPAIDANVFAFVAAHEFARRDFPQSGYNVYRLSRDVTQLLLHKASLPAREIEEAAAWMVRTIARCAGG